jgi:hypothetical protein
VLSKDAAAAAALVSSTEHALTSEYAPDQQQQDSVQLQREC